VFGGSETEIAGVESDGRSWDTEACCWASRLSCSWACSRISCCRSSTREDMADGFADLPLGIDLDDKTHTHTHFKLYVERCFYVPFGCIGENEGVPNIQG